MKMLRCISFLVAALAWLPLCAEEAGDSGFDIQEVIFGHTGDSYEWHITDIGDKAIAIHLPVIVRSSTGWHVFSSVRIAHGAEYMGLHIAESGDYDGKIVEVMADGSEVRPLDISITKNVCSMMISSALLVFLILFSARWYRRHDVTKEATGGLAAWMEPVVEMIDSSVIKDSIGEGYEKFSPYLLTCFFWILLNNILGIVPFFPGGANVTGNIAVTCVLGLCTFFVISIFGTKRYYKDIFWPDVPVWMKFPVPLMPMIELFSALLKPVTLMIRLFANMLGGHIIAISLVCIIFIFAKLGPIWLGSMAVTSVAFGIFMDLLELLVSFIQAYVFTILSAVFIGIAREK